MMRFDCKLHVQFRKNLSVVLEDSFDFGAVINIEAEGIYPWLTYQTCEVRISSKREERKTHRERASEREWRKLIVQSPPNPPPLNISDVFLILKAFKHKRGSKTRQSSGSVENVSNDNNKCTEKTIELSTALLNFVIHLHPHPHPARANANSYTTYT